MRLVALVALYLGLCALLPPAGVAFAADERPPPTKEQKREAAKKFKEGEKAFLKNDFVNAATAFEAAYEIAPHPDVLINAVDAHEKAGNLPRAATLCARVLKNPQNDRVRSDMQARLARLTPKIGRIEIAAPASTTEIKLDGGEAPLGELLYVDPGDHRASGRIDGVLVEKAVNVVAGARATVTLEAPDEEESEGGSGSGGSKKPPEDDDEKPLHPAFFFVGVGLTCVSAGILTWSGVDTLSARDEFDKNPTEEGLSSGESKQLRTNVMIGVTAALGVATAAIGIFAVEWGGGTDTTAKVSMTPGGVALTGTFR